MLRGYKEISIQERLDGNPYKYRLHETVTVNTDIMPVGAVKHKYFSLSEFKPGVLIINPRYCWDGASGPAIDTGNWMKASLVHDVFYQCIREHLISKRYRKKADKLMYKLLRKEGMGYIRAKYSYFTVRMFGRFAI